MMDRMEMDHKMDFLKTGQDELFLNLRVNGLSVNGTFSVTSLLEISGC